jgi:hypothetical protein
MSRQLKSHQHFLELVRTAHPKQRKALLETISDKQLDAVCSCAHNLLRGNIPLTAAQRRKLSVHKNPIRTLADKSVSRQAKKKILNQRGGFFLGGILKAILPPVLGSLLGSK